MTQRNITTDEFNEAINRIAEFVKTGVISPAPKPAEPDEEETPEYTPVTVYRMVFSGGRVGYYGDWMTANNTMREIALKVMEYENLQALCFTAHIYQDNELLYTYWGEEEEIESALHNDIKITITFNTDTVYTSYKSAYDISRIAALGAI